MSFSFSESIDTPSISASLERATLLKGLRCHPTSCDDNVDFLLVDVTDEE